MSDRQYNFELPLNCPSFYLPTLIGKIVAGHLWEVLPIPLLDKLVVASNNGTGVEITKRDLDSIPDDVWARALKIIG